MTLIEKITTLNWFDFLRKIKDILMNLNSQAIEEAPEDGTQYARQDGEWTEVTGGGGSQDLQSVLDIENFANFDSGNVSIDILSGSEGSRFFGVTISEDTLSTIEQYSSSINIQSDGSGKSGSLFIDNGTAQLKQTVAGQVTNLIFEDPVETTNIKVPAKPTNGDYTIATLDDIQSPLPTYADNASAITGGLVADNWYKTATGELRVVV